MLRWGCIEQFSAIKFSQWEATREETVHEQQGNGLHANALHSTNMVQQSVPAAIQQRSNEPRFQQARTSILNTTVIPDGTGTKWSQNKGLHLCHLNVHYLYVKVDEIKTLLHEQNTDVLCLCETFLNQKFSDDELKVSGYDFIRKDTQTHGGGLIIYIKSFWSFTHRADMETNDIESIWVEFKNNKQKTVFTCYRYRPPSSSTDWINKFENNIERAISDNREIILLGDFNFNLFQEHSATKSWKRLINVLNFQQLINKPTRVTDISETLIDHVYSNMPKNVTETAVPYLSVSDHFPVCFTRKMNSSCPNGPVHKTIDYRDTKQFDEILFLQDLENLPWFLIESSANANEAYDIFTTLFLSVLEKHASKKSCRVKHEIQTNWINPEILLAIKTRDKYNKDKNTEQYKIWRYKGKSLINQSKTDYFSETINNNHNNPRQLWRNLHDITEKRKDHMTAFINDEFGNTILDTEITANTSNKFFSLFHINIWTVPIKS